MRPEDSSGIGRIWQVVKHEFHEVLPGKGYVAILPLYGPTQAAIDKSWKPGDIQREE